jgi:hypothetical protein
MPDRRAKDLRCLLIVSVVPLEEREAAVCMEYSVDVTHP